MLRPPIDGADPSTSAHHRSLNVFPEFKRVFRRAQNLLNLSPSPAGQVIPSLLFSSLVQSKVATDSGTGLAVLRACRHSGSSGPSGGGGSGDSSGGDGGDDSDGNHDGGCDDDGSGGGGAGGGGGGVDGCFVAILLCMRSNPLTTAFPANGATGAAAASATTASLQRRRHQRHADLPASAHVWLC